jgi:prephenate dehydrogenase
MAQLAELPHAAHIASLAVRQASDQQQSEARKLAAQFYLYDMSVFKVMFTAIVTATVDWLDRLGSES